MFKAGEQESFCAKMRELMAGREEIEVGAPEFAEFYGDGRRALDGSQACRPSFSVAAVYSASCFSISQAISTASSMQLGSCGADPYPIRCP